MYAFIHLLIYIICICFCMYFDSIGWAVWRTSLAHTSVSSIWSVSVISAQHPCVPDTHTDHAVCNRWSKGPHLHIVRVQPQNWVCSCVGAVLCTLFIFSEIERTADNLSGASSNSQDWKVTLAKAARLLNELATTLSELQEADPAHQYTQAANEQT